MSVIATSVSGQLRLDGYMANELDALCDMSINANAAAVG